MEALLDHTEEIKKSMIDLHQDLKGVVSRPRGPTMIELAYAVGTVTGLVMAIRNVLALDIYDTAKEAYEMPYLCPTDDITHQPDEYQIGLSSDAPYQPQYQSLSPEMMASLSPEMRAFLSYDETEDRVLQNQRVKPPLNPSGDMTTYPFDITGSINTCNPSPKYAPN